MFGQTHNGSTQHRWNTKIYRLVFQYRKEGHVGGQHLQKKDSLPREGRLVTL